MNMKCTANPPFTVVDSTAAYLKPLERPYTHGYFSYACYAWIPFKVAMSAAVSENP